MKKILHIMTFLMISAISVSGQDVSNNFIATRVPLSTNDTLLQVDYYDGIGRPYQSLTRNASINGNDLVSMKMYDRMGLDSCDWLPAPFNSQGSAISKNDFRQGASSAYGDSQPYALTLYAPDPLQRVSASFGEGYSWHSSHKAVNVEYLANIGNGELRCVRLSADTDGQITQTGNYADGQCRVVKTTDEDSLITLKFTDMNDSTVLVRRVLGTGTFADTYFVYDYLGNLRYVLPPEASSRLLGNAVIPDGDNTLRQYGYIYKYDYRSRLIEKKLPGCAQIYYAYDKTDLPVYTQDGNQGEHNRYTLTSYDNLGRVAYVAEVTDTRSIEDIRTALRYAAPRSNFISTGTVGYDTTSGWGAQASDILQVNYYDDYRFLSIFTAHSDSLAYRVMNGYDNKYQGAGDAVAARGMLTGTATRVLNTGGNGGLLVRSMYYDLHGNVIQSHEQNHLGGYEHRYYQLTFTGKPLKEMHVHTTADTTNIDIYEYTYDNMERLLSVTVRHDGASAVTLCQNTYNALGQLASQSLGSSAQGAVNYTYNVRGWTSSIVSPPFKQYLHYQDSYGTASPCWNGNISAMEWESLDALIATQPARHSYQYTYDGLNRLTAAAHEAVDYDDWSNLLMMSNEPDYSCTYGYDLNGNITSLTRHGVNIKVNVFDNEAWHFGEIDHLSMTYDGNRLRNVTDQCTELTYAGAMDFKDGADKTEEYQWDANGNMTRDRNKGIYEISYNVLNLPERIRYYDGHEVRYTYAADGRKLHVDYLLNLFAIIDDEWGSDPEPQPFPSPNSTGNLLSGGDGLNGGLPGQIDPIVFEPQVLMTRDWCGGHLYRNGALERIENAYGYWADSCYHYRITDYQGNIRAVISQSGVLEEVNGYYPYGGLLGALATGVQPLKYGGKELDRENGLDWYDFEARMYDPMLPQFKSIDRKAEDYPSTSPFAYCTGNPIRYTDPTGEKKIISFDPRDEKHGNNDSQRFMAKEYPDDDAIHIFSHGYKNGISVFHNGKRVIIRNPKELDAFLSERSVEWKTRKNNEKMTIILHSCETGQGDNSFAERVSKDFKNTVVIAPDEKVVVNKDTRLYGVYQTQEEYDGENILTKPIKLGHWKVFEAGKVIATYMGIWKPKSKITFFDYIYKLKQ